MTKQEELNELLPCPFCGEIPEKYNILSRPLFNEKGFDMVRCKNTKCAIWNIPVDFYGWQKRAK